MQFFLDKRAKWIFYGWQACLIFLVLFGSIASFAEGVIGFYYPYRNDVINYNTAVSYVSKTPPACLSDSLDLTGPRSSVGSGCGHAPRQTHQSRSRWRTPCRKGSRTSITQPIRSSASSS